MRVSRFLRSAVLVAAGGGIAAFLLAGSRFRRHRPSDRRTPASLDPPKFDELSIPSLPPVRLKADTVDAFVRWVAGVPVSKAQLIRDEIATVRGDDVVLAALVARLFELPVTDFGRHHLLLSILGELSHPNSVEPLLRFINLPGDSVFPQPQLEQSEGCCTSYLDYYAALQSRAAEMLAFLKTPEALSAVLAVASQHGSRAVRLAALDAFIFNHDDSPEAIDRARAAARPSEAKLVGLPRRVRDFNPDDFDAKVLAFYERYPEENPPNPGRSAHPKHEDAPLERPRQRRY